MKKSLQLAFIGLCLTAAFGVNAVAAGIPTISSFSPASGPVGTSVTITGTNFNTAVANNIVFFGAVKATVSAATATSLTVTVPVSATYAPISVLNSSNNLLAYSSKPFIPTFVPNITSLTAASFATNVDLTSGTFPTSTVIADLDGDGKPDLVNTDYNHAKIYIYLNTSTSGNITSASFAAPQIINLAANNDAPYWFAIGDLDGDGKPDLVIPEGYGVGFMHISALRNTSTVGNISFAAAQTFASGPYPVYAVISDIDGDGKADVIVANSSLTNTDGSISVIKNTSTLGNISLAAPVDFITPPGSSPNSVAVGDLDGDGKPDIVAANTGLNSISIFRNIATTGVINSASLAARIDITVGNGPTINIGDLDGDGKPDLVTTNQNDKTISLLRNTSSGSISFAAATNLSLPGSPNYATLGDLDGDGLLDLIVPCLLRNSNTISIFRNTSSSGTVSFATKFDLPGEGTGASSFPEAAAIGDLDGDGRPDFIITNDFRTNSPISIYRSLGPAISTTGTLTAFTTTSGTASASQSFTVAGSTLSTDITVTAPMGFELSTTSGGTYSGTLTLTQTSGTVATTTVYARLASTATGTPSGNIAIASTGASTQNVAVTGTVIGPTITLTGTLTTFTACSGSASTSQSFTVAGSTLGTNVLTVTPPAGFELSTTSNGPYAGTAFSLTPASGTVATTTIYARMASATTSPTAGNIIVASTGATSQTVAVSGTVNVVPTITLGTVNTVFTTSTSFSVPYTATTGTPTQYSISTGTRALAGFAAVSNATLGASPISVTIPISAAGTYDFNLTVNTATCTSVTVPFTLTIAVPSPTIAVTGTLSALSTTYGTASSTGTFNVSGNFMTAGILVTAPTGFEVSLSSSSGFGSTVTVGAAGNIASTPVYIRLLATDVANSYFGNITLTSLGASNVTVATVSSTVSGAPITITATNAVKTYGSALTGNGSGSTAYTLTSGSLQNGNTLSSVTIAYAATSSGALATDAATTYTGTIIPSAAIGANGFLTGNYTITYANGNITVNKAALTITATGPAKPFGTALTAGTSAINFTASTTVNSETVTSVTLTPDAAGQSASTAINSPYVVTPSAATGTNGFLASNYNITYIPYNGTVVNVAPTILTTGTLTALSTTYGTASSTGTFSVSGTNITGGILVTPPSGFEVSLSASSGFGSSVTVPGTGTIASTPVYIRLLATDAANTYLGNVVLGSAGATSQNVATVSSTVSKATLTITANNQTKVYGAAVPTLTASYSGFVNSETSANLAILPTFGTTAAPASHVAGSPYTITSSGAASSNYTISYVAGSLTVTTAPLTITANNQTKAYGASLPTLTATYTGFVNSDTQSSLTTAPSLSTTATASSSVAGSPYTITASGAVDADYTISYTPGTLTVTPAALTITATSTSKTYGSANPTFAVTYTGFVGTDNAASLTTAPTVTSTAVTNSGVGTYPITASGAVNSNYSIGYVAGTLTVNKAALIITASNGSKVYGAVNPTLAVTYSGFVGTDNAASLTIAPTITTTAGTTSPVNTYPITPSGAASSNYSISYVAGTLTVTSAALTITATNTSKVYGSINPTLAVTYSGFVGTDNASSLTTQPAINTTAVTLSQVTTYPITASGAVNPNYSITYVAGTLTVTPAALTITATNASKTYGAANPALAVTYSGFVGTDNVASLTTAPSISTTAVTTSPVATYPITASGATADNYSISYIAGTLTVTQAVLTITAINASKTYGSANPALAVTYSGFVGTDNATSLTTAPTITTTAVSNSPVNTYPITASGALSPNYSISYTPGTLTITPAALTITATNASKTYGSANPALAVTYSGFIGTDNAASLTTAPSISTTAVTSSPVGTYPITVSGAASGNYTFSYTGAILTVNPAALTVTANNQSRYYGVANPVLSATYTGFVNNDNAASLVTPPTISTTASITSLPNTYPITVASAASPNYTISYSPGILTVLALTNANLGSLSISTGTLSPAFAQSTTAYTTAVANAVTSVTLTPTAADPTATIKVNGSTVASGSASATIPLTVGQNIISTVVTAQDGTTTITYTVTVTRAPSSNASLAGLTISSGTLTPAFATGTFNYTDLVDNTISQVTLTTTLADATATILVNGVPTANATASNLINLLVGDNPISVFIKAQDGITILTYTIIVHRATAPNAIKPNNILSPNGDGKNDTWVVKDIQSYPNNKVTVYDRAGRIVYTKNVYGNDWDGTFRGSPLAEGTYYYVIDLGTGDDPIKGFITIVRSR